MKQKSSDDTQWSRDGKESLPEPMDLEQCWVAEGKKRHDDDNLDEALQETFPASDAIATGRFE